MFSRATHAGRLILSLFVLLPLSSFAAQEHWVATWGSSQLKASGGDMLPRQALDHATLRQTVHVSLGGEHIRLQLSNVFGEQPLVLSAVQVARPGSNAGSIASGTSLAVRCNGMTAITIPPGADYLSDPIDMHVAPLSDLVVTMRIERSPESVTFHSGARATALLAAGDHIAEEQLSGAQALLHWYFLSGVEVAAPAERSAVVVLGACITDGHGATNDANDRWTDVLARRVAPLGVGVVNQGIGGNRILHEGLGPSAVSRFDRDVLAVPGVRYLIVLEGINDLGTLSHEAASTQPMHDQLVEDLKGAMLQMIAKAHAHGIAVYGATLTPYQGSDYYHPDARAEADRTNLNEWIRTSHVFDAVIDFDAVMTDPAHPGHLVPAFDGGDHLHPGPVGYAHMGESVSLKLFEGRHAAR